MKPMSDNVFADLGLDNSDDLAIKTDLAISIVKLIRARKLSQTQVAKMSGWTQAKVSSLMNARLDDISVDRLLRVAHALHYNVRITLDEAPSDAPASASVEVLPFAFA